MNGHDDDRRIEGDDDRHARAARGTFGNRDDRCARPGEDTYRRRDDRPAVELSVDERVRFDEIASSMWLLRLTGGRCATIPAGPWICVFVAVIGAAVGIVALGRLPIVVPFVGFVLALIGLAELSRHVAGSQWSRRAKELLGLELQR